MRKTHQFAATDRSVWQGFIYFSNQPRSPWMCLTLFGWGLCREKNEGWLKAPNRGQLVISFLANSAVNGTWGVWLWLLAPVVARECGVRAIDISWNRSWRFDLNLREFKKKLLNLWSPFLMWLEYKYFDPTPAYRHLKAKIQQGAGQRLDSLQGSPPPKLSIWNNTFLFHVLPEK